MATHDYVIANNTGANVRSDINGALAAIVSNNSSSTEPSTTYAYQWWADTNANVLKIRNSANNAWITLRELDGTMLIEDGSASTPGLAFADDVNTGIFSGAADQIGFATGGAERLEIGSSEVVVNDPSNDVDFRVESDGNTHMFFVDGGNNRVGIGEDQTLDALLVVKGDSDGAANPSIRLKDGTDTREAWISNSAGDLVLANGGNDNVPHCRVTLLDANIIQLNTANTERARIDADGRLLVGTTSNFHRGNLQVIDNGGGELFIGRNDTTVEDNNDLGHIFFGSNDSDTTAGEYASITCDADADHASGSAATRLEFAVTASGSTTPTEAMRIENDGTLLVGTTASDMVNNTSGGGCALDAGGINASASGEVVANFNRSNGDGTIVTFRSQGSSEGSVSISGSTTSFNGGHLSRWSQLADGAARTEILRGSVLSNLDQMCVWGEEDNEQLNRMKVSDVEGDVNVSGVFQCWDDDDETYVNDFFCAMTGDFVIRIAQGTTVARGDLLMSAGDGTAKPQDDDIIRSKTIAKVTSTVVSTTHADGSYCVPCVLMAC